MNKFEVWLHLIVHLTGVMVFAYGIGYYGFNWVSFCFLMMCVITILLIKIEFEK